MDDDDLRPHPDRRPRVVYREQLRVPRWWWAALAAGTALVLAVLLTGGGSWWAWVLVVVAPAFLAWSFLHSGRDVVEVLSDGQGGGALRAGSAELPFEAIGRSAPVPAAAKQAAMGRQLDPEAFVVHRNHIPAMVIVVLDDPGDPTPYWLVSTRKPEELASALPNTVFD